MALTQEGAIKIAAGKAGITPEAYIRNISNGIKKCTTCKEWKDLKSFCSDKSRHDGIATKCRSCSRGLSRIRSMKSTPRIERRAGDKVQARKRINSDIELGLRTDPDDLYCAKCGHKGTDRRHEYHHVMGYEPEHHYDVLPLCTLCHHEEHPKNDQD